MKTLLQLQTHDVRGGAAAAASSAPAEPPRQGMMSLLRSVARQGALFAGLPIAVLRQCINAGTSVGLYPTVRALLLAPGESKESMPLWKRALAGAATGSIGQALAQPADVIKTRLQADTRLRARGLPPRYAGAGDALARILALEGAAGLYSAMGSSVWRAGIINSAGIASYDGTKQAAVLWLRTWEARAAEGEARLLGGGGGAARPSAALREFLPSAVAALVCGVVTTVVSTPLDVVKTRIMSNPGRYRGPNDCLLQLVRSEGALSLWKGITPIYYRQAVWNGVFWVSLESLQRALGQETV